MNFNTLNKKVAKLKVCFIRSSSYMNIANFAMILFMFILSLFPNFSLKIRVILTIAGFMFALLIGYLDIRFRLMNEEQNYIVSKNDVVMDYIKQINEIDKKMDRVLEKIK